MMETQPVEQLQETEPNWADLFMAIVMLALVLYRLGFMLDVFPGTIVSFMITGIIVWITYLWMTLSSASENKFGPMFWLYLAGLAAYTMTSAQEIWTYIQSVGF